MAARTSGNPLDNPAYLRRESRRLQRVIKILTDREIKKALAAHAFYLAQQAEAIDRMAHSSDFGMTVEGSAAPVANTNNGERGAVNHLRAEAEQTLDGARTLRRLAEWYRSYAERAGNPAIWEARLQMAADLEVEAEGIERRHGGLDPDQGGGSATG
jgi:hypothetical protein